MRKTLALGIISLFTTFSFSQNKWELMEKKLYNQHDKGELSSDEWFFKKQKEAGSIPNRLSALAQKGIQDFSSYR